MEVNAIRNRIAQLEIARNDILDEVKIIQDNCPHETSVYSARGSSGGWDYDAAYWFDFYCYDCKKRWSTDQSVRPKGPLRVDRIDFDEKPEVIELKIRIEEIKR